MRRRAKATRTAAAADNTERRRQGCADLQSRLSVSAADGASTRSETSLGNTLERQCAPFLALVCAIDQNTSRSQGLSHPGPGAVRARDRIRMTVYFYPRIIRTFICSHHQAAAAERRTDNDCQSDLTRDRAARAPRAREPGPGRATDRVSARPLYREVLVYLCGHQPPGAPGPRPRRAFSRELVSRVQREAKNNDEYTKQRDTQVVSMCRIKTGAASTMRARACTPPQSPDLPS